MSSSSVGVTLVTAPYFRHVDPVPPKRYTSSPARAHACPTRQLGGTPPRCGRTQLSYKSRWTRGSDSDQSAPPLSDTSTRVGPIESVGGTTHRISPSSPTVAAAVTSRG